MTHEKMINNQNTASARQFQWLGDSHIVTGILSYAKRIKTQMQENCKKRGNRPSSSYSKKRGNQP